jgi:hypothetical protein
VHPLPVTFCIASPRGELSVDQAALGMPLDGCPGTTYGAYFQGIREFLDRDEAGRLRALAEEAGVGAPLSLAVRAEKHGAFYHPASVEVRCQKGGLRLGVIVAAEELGRTLLKEEFKNLGELHQGRAEVPVPKPLDFQEKEALSFLLEQWFSGFHEFHATAPDAVELWDYDTGCRALTPEQAAAVYERAAYLLASLYDPATGRQVHPWHHAAGDFIASVPPHERGAEVRLTTVRGYGAHPLLEDEDADPSLALFLFFMDVCLRMRLDRHQGTGETLWLGDFCLRAAVRGCLEGLDARPEGSAALRALLALFGPDELAGALEGVAGCLSPSERTLVCPRLREHAQALSQALREAGEGRGR